MNKKPNVIYILADDMGYGDISAFNENCPFTTPNFDAMCENGLRFTVPMRPPLCVRRPDTAS